MLRIVPVHTRSEVNLQESVLSSHQEVLGITLRPSGLVADIFTAEPSHGPSDRFEVILVVVTLL